MNLTAYLGYWSFTRPEEKEKAEAFVRDLRNENVTSGPTFELRRLMEQRNGMKEKDPGYIKDCDVYKYVTLAWRYYREDRFFPISAWGEAANITSLDD